nr:EOG090X06NK [Leptodora kindtii]
MADECVAKKLRTNPDGACSEEAPASASNETSSGCESLSGFQIKRILMENCESKLIVVEGSFERNSSQNTVVVLEKSHFLESEVRSMLATGSKIETQFRNDIYASLTCYPPSELNGIKVTLIHPATEKHVDKYTTKQRHLVEESREAYEEITLPHINGSCFSIDWVFNILDGRKEADRIIFNDPDLETGFVLLPDMKWDCKTTTNLYLVAIVRKRGIKSLRDIRAEHLPLLENIMKKGCVAIEEKYGVQKSELRVYLHYQPSYYHLHIHFTSLQFTPAGCSAERAHLLQSVMRNVRSSTNYYRDAVLDFVFFEGDSLLAKHIENFKLGKARVET